MFMIYSFICYTSWGYWWSSVPWSTSFWYQPVAWHKRHTIFCFWKIRSQALSGNPGGENEVDVPETNHSKKASQGDHSGGHGGHEDDDEEVRKCGQKIIQTDTIVADAKFKQKAFAELPAFPFNKIPRNTVATACVSKLSKLWIFIEWIPLNSALSFAWWGQAFLQTSSFYKLQAFVCPVGLFHFHIAPREGQAFPKCQWIFLSLNCKGALKSWQPAVLAREKSLALARTVKGFCSMQQHSEKSDKSVCSSWEHQQYWVWIWLTVPTHKESSQS